MENYIEIDVMKYVPLNTHVSLEPTFRTKLFRLVATKACGQRKLANLLFKREEYLSHCKSGSIRPRIDIVLKCAEIAGIQKDELSIRGRKDLEKFYTLVGFGKHIEKNKKLKKFLKEYKYKYYYTFGSVRFEQILRILKVQTKLTAKQIASMLDISHRRVNMILNKMI